MDGWERMDQATLDDAYDNGGHIPDAASYPPRWARDAAAFRAATACALDLPYADDTDARFDLFHPTGSAHGLVVYVHGGYWRRFDKSDWSHFAAGAIQAGHAVAMVGYPLAPGVRLSRITQLVAQAVDAAAARVSGPIRLTGHSAGGHLVARIMMPDVAPDCADRIATCVPISPLSDLRPFLPQTMNSDLRLDLAEAEAESPVLARPSVGARVTVHVGGAERPSFLWQARALGQAWNVPVHVAPGRHHFDVIDALTDPTSDMMRDLLA